MSKPVREQGKNPKRPSLLRNKIKECRNKTSWYIACSIKAVLPRNLDIPRDKHGTRDKKSPLEPPYDRTTTRPTSNSVGET